MSTSPNTPEQRGYASKLPIALALAGGLLALLGGRVFSASAAATALAAAGVVALLASTALRARRGGALLALPHGLAALALAVPLGISLGGAPDGGATVLLHAGWVALLAVAVPMLVATERAAAAMVVPAANGRGPLRRAAVRGATSGLWLVAVVALNFVVSQRDLKWDLTYFKTTAPSAATQATAAELLEPVEALLFFAAGDEALAEVRPYFDGLAAAAAKLEVRVVDHALEPELARELKIRGNGWIVLRRSGKAGEQATERIEVGERFEQARRALRSLDGKVLAALSRLAKGDRRVALTSGHRERSKTGEREAPEGQRLRKMHDLLDRFAIATRPLGLADGLGDAVPDDVAAVVAVGPRAAFLDEEVASLRRYVAAGGRLLLLLDPRRDDGLEPLLAALGVERRAGVLCAEKSHLRRTFGPADRALVVASGYSTHPIVTTANRNAGRVATVLQAGGALRESSTAARLPGAQVAFPLRTEVDTFLDRDGDFERDDDEKAERLEVVAAVTIPASRPGGRQGRAVVVADGDLVTDALIGNPGNAVLFVDALRWLIGEESVDAMPSDEADVAIEHRRDEDALWFYGTTVVAPLPLLAMAWWMARRRRRRARGGEGARDA